MLPEQVCLDIDIPPGCKPGAKLFVEGEGGRSEPDGKRGDLFVYVHVEVA
jgi:DnaJ-class molecular chaperone